MTGKMKRKAIKAKNSPKGEYIIIGSNNFWYACGLTNLAQVKTEIQNIKAGGIYGNEEESYNPRIPERIYVYKAVEINV